MTNELIQPQNTDESAESTRLPEQLDDLSKRILKRSKLRRKEREQAELKLSEEFTQRLEQGETADQITESIGKPSKKARRLKHQARKQRWFIWHLWIWGWRAFLCFLMFYIGCVIYLATGTIKPDIDYVVKLNDRALALAEEDKAWPIYREALHKHEIQNISVKHLLSEEGRFPKPGEPKWEEMIKLLEAHQNLIKTIRRGSKKAGMGLLLKHNIAAYDEVDGHALFGKDNYKLATQKQEQAKELPPDPDPELENSLMETVLISGGWARELSLLMLMDAERLFIEGIPDQAIQNITATFRFGAHYREPGTLINDVVGISIFNLTLWYTLEHVLHEKSDMLSEAHLKSLLSALNSTSSYEDSNIHYEAYVIEDWVQRVYCTNGKINHKHFFHMFTATELFIDEEEGRHYARWTIPLLPILSLLIAGEEEQLAFNRLYWQMVFDFDALPLWEQLGQSSGLDESMDMMEQVPLMKYRYWVTYTLMPFIESTCITRNCALALRDQIKLLIALKLYRVKHGDYPDSLVALGERYPDIRQTDHTTGDQVQYKLVKGEPLLYCFGLDGDDDGGKPSNENTEYWPQLNYHIQTDGDWVIWPKPNALDTEGEDSIAK